MATNINTEELTYCEVHPDRETSLRCNKCNRLMCTECAVQTPVGYRCKQCVRQQEDKFFSATQTDYIVVFLTCAVLGGIGAVVSLYIGFWIFILLLAAPVGGAIGEAALRLTKRRRGRYSGYIAAAGIVIGALIAVSLLVGGFEPRVFLNVPVLLFVGIAAFAVYGRYRMKI